MLTLFQPLESYVQLQVTIHLTMHHLFHPARLDCRNRRWSIRWIESADGCRLCVPAESEAFEEFEAEEEEEAP